MADGEEVDALVVGLEGEGDDFKQFLDSALDDCIAAVQLIEEVTSQATAAQTEALKQVATSTDAITSMISQYNATLEETPEKILAISGTVDQLSTALEKNAGVLFAHISMIEKFGEAVVKFEPAHQKFRDILQATQHTAGDAIVPLSTLVQTLHEVGAASEAAGVPIPAQPTQDSTEAVAALDTKLKEVTASLFSLRSASDQVTEVLDNVKRAANEGEEAMTEEELAAALLEERLDRITHATVGYSQIAANFHNMLTGLTRETLAARLETMGFGETIASITSNFIFLIPVIAGATSQLLMFYGWMVSLGGTVGILGMLTAGWVAVTAAISAAAAAAVAAGVAMTVATLGIALIVAVLVAVVVTLLYYLGSLFMAWWDSKSAAAALNEELEKVNKSLQEEIETIGMSAHEKEIWKLREMGATEAQLEAVKAKHQYIEETTKEVEAMKAAEKAIEDANKAAKDHIKQLELQIATFGMTKAAAEEYKLTMQGVDAGTIAQVKALMEQLQVLQDKKKADEEAHKALEKHNDAIGKAIHAHEEAFKTMKMTKEELEDYKLQLLGADELERNYALGLWRSVEAHKAGQKALEELHKAHEKDKEAVTGIIDKLKEQVWITNEEAEAKDLYRAALHGATEEQKEEIRALHEALEMKKAHAKLEKEAEKLMEKHLDPSAKLAKAQAHLNEMLLEGMIDQETYNKELDEVTKKIMNVAGTHEIKLKLTGLEGIEAGTAEAAAALQEFRQLTTDAIAPGAGNDGANAFDKGHFKMEMGGESPARDELRKQLGIGREGVFEGVKPGLFDAETGGVSGSAIERVNNKDGNQRVEQLLEQIAVNTEPLLDWGRKSNDAEPANLGG
jgi:hypothetical protein